MNPKIIALICLTVIILFSGCVKTPPPPTDSKIKIFEVRLDVGAPFSDATLVFDAEGNITYEADAPKMGIEKKVGTAKITLKQFQELTELIKENDFFSFNERYEEEDLMDETTYTITVKYSQEGESKTHKVSCYGECPKEVVEIRNKLKELWGGEILEIGV